MSSSSPSPAPGSIVSADIAEWQAFTAQRPDLAGLELLFTPLSGAARGKFLRPQECDAVFSRGRAIPVSLVATDVTGGDVAETGMVWEAGDLDGLLRPAPGTLVPAAASRPGDSVPPRGQVIVSLHDRNGVPHPLDPRVVLAQLQGRLEAHGVAPVVACELEFHLLDGRIGRDGRPRGFRTEGRGQPQRGPHQYGLEELSDIGAFLDDLYAAADAQGLRLGAAISEFGPCQYELTLPHHANALRAADEAVMYKRLVKSVARRHGHIATFMAKPFADQAGNGLHLHLSLADQDGRNLFANEQPGSGGRLDQCLAGMLSSMADALLLLAPNANSYRRFRANSYAPTQPAWGVDNRTCALRVTAGDDASRHIEHRLAGADANPYLAVAALLGGALAGLEGQLDPGPPVAGSAYGELGAASWPALPLHWPAAIERFQMSQWAADMLSPNVRDTLAIVKSSEMDRFFAEVSRKDYDWYLTGV